jgi:CheY-like chemotaxis protein
MVPVVSDGKVPIVYGIQTHLRSHAHMRDSSAAPLGEDPGPERPPLLRPVRQVRRVGRARVVLIADDSADAREIYGSYLDRCGFRVHTSADGGAAIALALDVNPDVIVMDLAMPKMDGISATRRLKAHRRTRHIPVILLTGYPYQAIERGALEAGVAVFLTKPCLPEDLKRHVSELSGRAA